MKVIVFFDVDTSRFDESFLEAHQNEVIDKIYDEAVTSSPSFRKGRMSLGESVENIGVDSNHGTRFNAIAL